MYKEENGIKWKLCEFKTTKQHLSKDMNSCFTSSCPLSHQSGIYCQYKFPQKNRRKKIEEKENNHTCIIILPVIFEKSSMMIQKLSLYHLRWFFVNMEEQTMQQEWEAVTVITFKKYLSKRRKLTEPVIWVSNVCVCLIKVLHKQTWSNTLSRRW